MNNQKIKILFISLRADIGGGPMQMFDVLSNINQQLFQPFVAIPCEPPYYDKIKKLNIKILKVKKRTFSIFDLIGLISFIILNKIEIIHSHGRGAGIYSRLIKLFLPYVKIIHTFHGVNYSYDNIKSFFKVKLNILVERILSIFTDKFINVSYVEQVKNINVKVFQPQKTVIIQNVLPYERINELCKINDFNKLSKVDNSYYFCAVGRFDPIKQFSFLINAFIKSKNALNLNMKLILIGDGEELDLCKKIVKENNFEKYIIFLGQIPNVLDILVKCDFMIFTSKSEGLSISLLEAIALNLPLIIPNSLDFKQVINDYKYEKYVTFENNNYESFKESILKIVNNFKDDKNNFLDIKKVSNQHQEYIKQYENLYLNILNKNK